MLEVVAPFKHFNKLKEFVAMKLPAGFPVRIGLCSCCYHKYLVSLHNNPPTPPLTLSLPSPTGKMFVCFATALTVKLLETFPSKSVTVL